MEKKYLFFDIDGTLTNPADRQPVKSAVETLHRLRAAGHFVGIATGRPYSFTKDFARSTGIDHYVCSGGNTLVVDNEIIEDRPLPLEEAMGIIRYCKELHIPFAATIDNDVKMVSEHACFADLIQRANTLHSIDIVKTIEYEKTMSFRRIFVSLLTNHKLELPLKTLAASNYHKYFLTIEPDDKFLGIERMMQLLQAPLQDVVVFGDGINDIQMFQKAPFAIAMGNAIEDIKKLSNYITANSVDDGIQKACMHFGWI